MHFVAEEVRATPVATTPLKPDDVAVVIPTHRVKLKPDEIVSLELCFRVLGRYAAILVTGESQNTRELSERYPRLIIEKTNDSNFASENAYNRMLLSADFYKRFAAYQYILIHQLDALVFEDELLHWCSQGFDYVGAPFVSESGPLVLLEVGNGGFSLRRVSTFTRLLRSTEFVPNRELFSRLPCLVGLRFLLLLRLLMGLARWPTRRWYRSWLVHAFAFGMNAPHEDRFFSFLAPFFDKSFSKPSPPAALAFAFEQRPRELFELTGGRVPFGCHDWLRYDKKFYSELLRIRSLV